MSVLRALVLAWRDLLRPRILGVVALGVGLTLLLFVALQAAAFWAGRASSIAGCATATASNLPPSWLISSNFPRAAAI